MQENQVRTALRGAATAAICLSAALGPKSAWAGAVTLVWDTGATGTAGYAVYCGEAPRTYSSRNDVGNVTTIRVEGLNEASTYYCAVTAYDAARRESAYSNEVKATVGYAAPVVSFSASPTSGTAPANVTFSNATTGTVTSWSWSFGDGSYSDAQAPSHSYATPGEYYVTLTATGPGGAASKTLGTPIKVTAPTTKKRGKRK
jgi:PKD repeat protein